MLDKNNKRPRALAPTSVANLFKGQQMPAVKTSEYKKVQCIKSPGTPILFYRTLGQKSQFIQKARTAVYRKHLVFGANYHTPQIS